MYLRLVNCFYTLGWHTCPDRSLGYLGTLQYHGAGGYNSMTADLYIVHDDSTHTNEHIVVNSATMNDGIVPNGNIITNDRLGFFIRAMNYSAILYIHFITHADAVHITT